jgi:hypothetical protein
VKTLALVSLAACMSSARPHPIDGAIGGLTRDRDSGYALGYVTLRLRGTSHVETSTREGLFGFDHLADGRYTIDAQYGDKHMTIKNVDVSRGDVTIVEVDIGDGPSERDYVDDVLDLRIDHFTPTGHDPATGVIDGTITDAKTRQRIGGATITAVAGGITLQAISDDAGRYHFDPVTPGTYSISAYYAVSGHGQIEVRRSAIAVEAGHGVRVPLWIETQR